MKFSVIIPLYNKAPYLIKALETVCAQTYRDYEIIVINDGSTDNSAVVAEEYLKSTHGINYKIIHQPNAGVSVARNKGVEASIGEYIAFLDADDWWMPIYLEHMEQLITEFPGAGLYASNYVYYKPSKTRVMLNIPRGYINYPNSYYESGAMPIWTGATIMPRKVFDEMGGFPTGINLGEDFLLWAKTALHCPVVFNNEPLAYYNNDVPASLRATRNLHKPNHHMLFRLEYVFGNMAMQNLEIITNYCYQLPVASIETKQPTAHDWKKLIDKLRVNGLLEYWMSEEYHNQAAIELAKVDWSKQPDSVKRMYRTPIWMLKVKRQVKKWGSALKQTLLIRYRYQ